MPDLDLKKTAEDSVNAAHRVAAFGMVWTSLGVVFSKLASFIAQIVLGWVLSKEDFGLYAIAISASSVLLTLQNGGVHKILVQRCKEYETLAPRLFKIAFCFNVGIMALLLLAVPLLVNVYNEPGLSTLVVCLAISVPIGTPAAILRAKLLNELKFADSAIISTSASIVRYGSTIIFAILGLGPLSFVLPLIVVAVFENIMYWRCVRRWPRFGSGAWKLFRVIFRDIRWIMVGALVLTLSLQGDYLVIGLLQNKAVLGTYFFAFQLSIAFSIMFTMGFDSVMMPSFAQFSDQPDRQAAAFLKAVSMLAFLVSPFAVGIALLMDPLINICWAGKWNPAIVATQLLCLSLLTRLPMSLSQTYLEAKGLWRLRTILQGLDTAGLMFSAAVGAMVGDVLSISISVSVYRFVAGFLVCVIGSGLAGVSTSALVRVNLPTMFYSLVSGAFCFLLVKHIMKLSGPLMEAAAIVVVFVLVFGLLSMFFQRDRFKEVFALVYFR